MMLYANAAVALIALMLCMVFSNWKMLGYAMLTAAMVVANVILMLIEVKG